MAKSSAMEHSVSGHIKHAHQCVNEKAGKTIRQSSWRNQAISPTTTEGPLGRE